MSAYRLAPFQIATAVDFQERILSVIHVIRDMPLTYQSVIFDNI